MGTKLDNESLRIALGLHLGVPIVVEHKCVCGSKVDVFGTHGLSCRRSGGSGVWRCTCCFGTVGVCRDDGKRLDGMSLIPCSGTSPVQTQ